MAASTRCSGKAALAYLMLVCAFALIATSRASAVDGAEHDANQGRELKTLFGKGKVGIVGKVLSAKTAILTKHVPVKHVPIYYGKVHHGHGKVHHGH